MRIRWAALVLVSVGGWASAMAEGGPQVNCYTPVAGGWQIRLTADPAAAHPDPALQMGGVKDDARTHRRPLYPPAERSFIWTPDELAKIPRCTFRPIVLAYNAPHFLFDYHSAGGLLGHLYIGLSQGGASKWFHEWPEIDVAYVDGRMEYVLHDPAFAGVAVKLSAAPLADADGVIVKVQVEGAARDASLTWGYGGASGFFTNYNMGAPEFAFAPAQCAKDRLSWKDGAFTLQRAFDDNDAYMKEVFAAAKLLPGWRARVSGGSSWKSPGGLSDPAAFAASPAQLSGAVSGSPTEERDNCVAVQTIPLGKSSRDGYVVVGMGGNILGDVAKPAAAWKAALARNRSIAERIVTHTPDPYLDAAASMMAFATEGTWGDLAVVHGGWSWRFAYLGWRTWYGPDCYGWTDRIKKSIQNQTTLGLVKEGPDAGALGSLIEYAPGVFYNMNEVFLDHVRQYFEYTNDIELMREIFPVLDGIVSWEDRRLQPKSEHLYESALNTWISDSHWYIQGQCTQASAYMLRANTFLADLAPRLDKDPGPYRARAERIRAALQEKLWMPEQGVFAEYLDTRGKEMLHAEPELPTIYHAAEFGAASPLQVCQMLRWADAHLRTDSTPGGGKLVWSSNWYPNAGRSYTHSTYEMAYGEELNFALTNYLAGRADEAYALIRASLCGIFNGPTPGGLSCHAYVDGRQRANDEFADASSMWGRTLAEGLFGIVPKRPDGVVELSPQFPKDWPEASIATAQFIYCWRRDGGKVAIDWTSPEATSVRLRLPLPAQHVESVLVNGRRTDCQLEAGYSGVNWLRVSTPRGKKGTIRVAYTPAEIPAHAAPAPLPVPARKVWSAPQAGERDLNRWALIDLGKTYNANLPEVMKHVEDTAPAPALPASQVGFGYWKDHLTGRNQAASDAAWRAKVGADGVAWTTDGIPFKAAKTGPNIGVVTLAGGYPAQLAFPVEAKGRALYLMISGISYPCQSHVVNLRVTLRYADGTEETKDLVSPFDIGDCWSTWCGHFHDTAANGFENIGGRSGPAGSLQAGDLTEPIAVDTEAHLVPFELKPDLPLAQVRVEAYANDVIYGVMGATILK